MNELPGRTGVVAAAVAFTIGLLAPIVAVATDYSSSNFILRDPVITILGGRSSSTNFQILYSDGQNVAGVASSTSFIGRFGFLYFPIVTTPVLSGLPGDGQADLSWTASSGALGWTVGGYRVGRATTSGGPYTYTSVGNVLSATATGLANNVTYYFVAQPLDALGNAIDGLSNQVPITPHPIGSGNPQVPGPGPAPAPAPIPSAVFEGRAYPESQVTVLKDGTRVGSADADASGNFSFSVFDLPAGEYTFSFLAVDVLGRRSGQVSFRVSVISGRTTTIGGILLPPTLDTDKIEVRRGDPIAFFGSSFPGSSITFVLTDQSSGQEAPGSATAGADGQYRFSLGTDSLELGYYSIRIKATAGTQTSPFSPFLFFRVGAATVLKPPGLPPGEIPTEQPRIGPGGAICRRADFNCDGRVDLIDFSILVFWWEKPLSDSVRSTLDLAGGDGIVDIFDFSVLVYHWTG